MHAARASHGSRWADMHGRRLPTLSCSAANRGVEAGAVMSAVGRVLNHSVSRSISRGVSLLLTRDHVEQAEGGPFRAQAALSPAPLAGLARGSGGSRSQ